MNINLPSRIDEIREKCIEKAGIRLFVKRDDLLHPEVSGNKWRKLQYNLLEAKREKKKKIITFGGAFSNHIYALAAAGKHLGFSTVGVIRGDEIKKLNPTLLFAKACGMKLYFISRKDYQDKEKTLSVIDESLEECYVVPEGGTNDYALIGCGMMVAEVRQQFDGELPDYWCISCGTGGTLAGILSKLSEESEAIGFSALKGDFHQKEIKTLLAQTNHTIRANWTINTEYHFGGYARHQPALIDFINQFKKTHKIQLDPVYTGKLFYGIFDLLQKGYFKKGSSVLAIHTGGLQGITGFNQRFGDLID